MTTAAITRTTITPDEALTVANALRREFDELGPGRELEAWFGDLLVLADYEAEYETVRGGDQYCGIWETVDELRYERFRVFSVTDAQGNEYPKIAMAIEDMLNPITRH